MGWKQPVIKCSRVLYTLCGDHNNNMWFLRGRRGLRLLGGRCWLGLRLGHVRLQTQGTQVLGDDRTLVLQLSWTAQHIGTASWCGLITMIISLFIKQYSFLFHLMPSFIYSFINSFIPLVMLLLLFLKTWLGNAIIFISQELAW